MLLCVRYGKQSSWAEEHPWQAIENLTVVVSRGVRGLESLPLPLLCHLAVQRMSTKQQRDMHDLL